MVTFDFRSVNDLRRARARAQVAAEFIKAAV